MFRAVVARVVGIAVVLAATAFALGGLVRLGLLPPELEGVPSLTISNSLLTLVGGVWLTRSVSGLLLKALLPKMQHRAFMAANAVRIFGYTVAVLLALSFFGLSPVAVLAGGTFGGLVIGPRCPAPTGQLLRRPDRALYALHRGRG
jgi:small-conductance mechanosensitive channel